MSMNIHTKNNDKKRDEIIWKNEENSYDFLLLVSFTHETISFFSHGKRYLQITLLMNSAWLKCLRKFFSMKTISEIMIIDAE